MGWNETKEHERISADATTVHRVCILERNVSTKGIRKDQAAAERGCWSAASFPPHSSIENNFKKRKEAVSHKAEAHEPPNEEKNGSSAVSPSGTDRAKWQICVARFRYRWVKILFQASRTYTFPLSTDCTETSTATSAPKEQEQNPSLYY